MGKLEHKTFCGWYSVSELKQALDEQFADGWSIAHGTLNTEINVEWKTENNKQVPIYVFCILQRLKEGSLDDEQGVG